MGQVKVDEQSLKNIANSIRNSKTGTTTKYTPSEMSGAIDKLGDTLTLDNSAIINHKGNPYYPSKGRNLYARVNLTFDEATVAKDWGYVEPYVYPNDVQSNFTSDVAIDADEGKGISKIWIKAMKPQTEGINIIENGTMTFTPENNYVTGLTITTNVETPSEEKGITINSNGTQVVTPEEGKLLSKVTINTNVEPSTPYTLEMYNSESELTSITLKGQKKIRNNQYKDCAALSSVTLPDTLTNIGNEAFSGCTALTNIIIPASVTDIGSNAFKGCTGLTTITFLGTPTSISVDAFTDINGVNINVPWADETIVTGAPWGAIDATINYNSK